MWGRVREWEWSLSMNSNGQREHGPPAGPLGSVLVMLRIKGTDLQAFIREKYLPTKNWPDSSSTWKELESHHFILTSEKLNTLKNQQFFLALKKGDTDKCCHQS